MSTNTANGYAGKILRVDLTNERLSEETLDEATLRKWVGGVGFGAKYLYDEVPPACVVLYLCRTRHPIGIWKPRREKGVHLVIAFLVFS